MRNRERESERKKIERKMAKIRVKKGCSNLSSQSFSPIHTLGSDDFHFGEKSRLRC